MYEQTYCPITSEVNCKCIDGKPGISALQVDLRAALVKLFIDHGVFTALVLKSIVDGGRDTTVLLNRLNQNQHNIGDQLKPILGEAFGNELTNVLLEHIKLAGAVITAAAKNDLTLDDKITQLFDNSDEVAAVLTSINPDKLPYEVTQRMFHIHNQFIIDMTIHRLNHDYQNEITLFDAYIGELIQMANSIYQAL